MSQALLPGPAKFDGVTLTSHPLPVPRHPPSLCIPAQPSLWEAAGPGSPCRELCVCACVLRPCLPRAAPCTGRLPEPDSSIHISAASRPQLRAFRRQPRRASLGLPGTGAARARGFPPILLLPHTPLALTFTMAFPLPSQAVLALPPAPGLPAPTLPSRLPPGTGRSRHPSSPHSAFARRVPFGDEKLPHLPSSINRACHGEAAGCCPPTLGKTSSGSGTRAARGGKEAASPTSAAQPATCRNCVPGESEAPNPGAGCSPAHPPVRKP